MKINKLIILSFFLIVIGACSETSVTKDIKCEDLNKVNVEKEIHLLELWKTAKLKVSELDSILSADLSFLDYDRIRDTYKSSLIQNHIIDDRQALLLESDMYMKYALIDYLQSYAESVIIYNNYHSNKFISNNYMAGLDDRYSREGEHLGYVVRSSLYFDNDEVSRPYFVWERKSGEFDTIGFDQYQELFIPKKDVVTDSINGRLIINHTFAESSQEIAFPIKARLR